MRKAAVAEKTLKKSGILRRLTRWFWKSAPAAPFRLLGALLTLDRTSTILFILGLNALFTAISALSASPTLPTFINTFASKVAIPDKAIYDYTQILITQAATMSRTERIIAYAELYTQVFWFLVYLTLIGRIGKWFFMGNTLPKGTVALFSITGAAVLEALFILYQALQTCAASGGVTCSDALYLPLRGVFLFLKNYEITIMPVLVPIVAVVKGTIFTLFKTLVGVFA